MKLAKTLLYFSILGTFTCHFQALVQQDSVKKNSNCVKQIHQHCIIY